MNGAVMPLGRVQQIRPLTFFLNLQFQYRHVLHHLQPVTAPLNRRGAAALFSHLRGCIFFLSGICYAVFEGICGQEYKGFIAAWGKRMD
jgi:hypothetical protein